MYSTRIHLDLWGLSKEYFHHNDAEVSIVTPKWKIGEACKGFKHKKCLKRNKQKPAYRNYRAKKAK